MTAYLALCLLFLAITVKSDPTRCDAPSMEALVVEVDYMFRYSFVTNLSYDAQNNTLSKRFVSAKAYKRGTIQNRRYDLLYFHENETLQAFRLDLDTKHCSTKEISKEPRPLFGIPEHAKFGGESIHRDSGMYRESGILVNKWWANTERSHYIGFWTQDCLPVYETYEYTRIVYSYVELGIWDPNVFVPPLEKCFFP
ncbi:uncharacterized protein [Antedon mediterranea]|uniref:uncharacterized protein isoform X1 n=1 Tax=Antedon mediterranea TaxID=105859 RepID=UPI003AF4B44A